MILHGVFFNALTYFLAIPFGTAKTYISDEKFLMFSG
jgi:hypothetical protein